MRDIKGLNLEELESELKRWGEQAYHARQIFSWIYQKRAENFLQMTNLSLSLRKRLAENFSFPTLKLIKAIESIDGTKKLLLGLEDKNVIEAVIIPSEQRTTGCVSTQVGCKFCCRFCASGALGFKRNLTVAEILDEVLCLKNNSAKELTHLVFMGTGEPLDNYEFVLKAIRTINSSWGLKIGARRITISTSGVIPGIEKLAEEGLQIELSVSLHAAFDSTRSQIMPINKKYPLKELIAACRRYILHTDRQVTFEYILIKGLNSDLQNAKKLSKILAGLNCKVNLLPANPIKELKVEPPGKMETLLFKDALLKSGIRVTLRKARGQDIDASCGQLRLSYEKK